MHTHMNRPNWVLSHWAHFTVLRFMTACMCSIVTRCGGPRGIEAYPLNYYFLQCFDTVGWVI